MKKLISIILLFALCLSLTSCKKSEESASAADSSKIESGMQPSYHFSFSEAPSSSQPGVSQNIASSSESGGTSASAQGDTSSQESPVSTASQAAPVSSQTVSSESASSQSETVTISFFEGISMSQIIERLARYGVCSKDALFEAANSYDYSYYPLIGAITPTSSQRCFTLEGYLFPSTYDFYINQKPEDVFGVFLRNAERQLTPYVSRAQQMGLSLDQLLTLASLIERESTTEEMRRVSSVLHNRLNASMKLDCDASIDYVEYFIKGYISGDQNRYNSYYNTYKCPALPAGPICNPGKDAIEAALNPENTNYYYFFIDRNNVFQYSQTKEEHDAKLKAAGITG